MNEAGGKTKKSYVVRIQSFSTDIYKFKVQENTGWEFGQAFELDLPAKYFVWLSFPEIKWLVQSYLNWEELAEPWDDEESVSLMEHLKSNWRQFGVYVVCWLAFLVWTILSVWYMWSWNAENAELYSTLWEEYSKLSPEQKIPYLEQKIKQIRAEREKNHWDCVAMCQADRQVYDWMVTQMKWEQSMLILEANKKERTLKR